MIYIQQCNYGKASGDRCNVDQREIERMVFRYYCVAMCYVTKPLAFRQHVRGCLQCQTEKRTLREENEDK